MPSFDVSMRIIGGMPFRYTGKGNGLEIFHNKPDDIMSSPDSLDHDGAPANFSQDQFTSNTDDEIHRYVNRLRFKFLTPIFATLTLAVLVIISTVYTHEHNSIGSGVVQLHFTAKNLYHFGVQQNAKALQSIMDVLKTDQDLLSALKEKDRLRLLRHSAPIYQDINRHYGVTHFYYSDPDRVNLLRVHKPEKFGDVITRTTTLTAMKGGADSYGVELGPLGTLTLRYVQPWYDEQTQSLLGFVELGMEVDQTFGAVRDLFGVDLFLLINKQYLDQKGWEEGMRTFGRVPDWDNYPNAVLSVQGKQLLPDALVSTILNRDRSEQTSAVTVQLGPPNQYAIFQPLQDVLGRSVATMVMLVDTSKHVSQVRATVMIGSGIVIVAAALLILFFYWFVGRVGKRMAQNELQLQQMAIKDGLTGLYNRRQFNLMLKELIDIHVRYKRPASLIMIDIDHFKQINDSYGHLAGDAVLVEMGRRLARQVRNIDRACRYGGEEFALLLPETGAAEAMLFANRLCNEVASNRWDLDQETQISVTVSIGVAGCPEHAVSPQDMVAAADNALYEAKLAGRNRVVASR